MKYLCQNCKAVLEVEANKYGQKHTCEKCGYEGFTPLNNLSAGVLYDDFALIQKIGEGGMASVYQAHQLSLDRKVALKIFDTRKNNDPDQFLHEARAAARLNHPNIVQAYAAGQEGNILYFAQEFVEGKSLEEHILKEGPVSIPKAVNMVCKIGEALQYAWEAERMIHHDVTTNNILLTRSNEVKLADMGLAAFSSEHDNEVDDEFIGTPEYIAPEIILGNKADHRSDLYSLGILFYRAVTAHFPFSAENEAATAALHITAEPNLHHTSIHIPESIRLIMRKLMEKDPDNRYQNIDDLKVALEHALHPGKKTKTAAVRAEADWECPSCGRKNHMGETFCVSCGYSAVEDCLICNEKIRIGSKYCPLCGGDLEEKRRIEVMTHEHRIKDLKENMQYWDHDKIVHEIKYLKQATAKSYLEVLRSDLNCAILEARTLFENCAGESYTKRSLGLYESSVKSLVDLFSKVSYSDLYNEMEQIKATIRYAVIEAEAAVNLKCISYAFSALNKVEVWTGGELGERYSNILEKCKYLYNERKQLIIDVSKLIDDQEYNRALIVADDLHVYCNDEKLSLSEPAEEDLSIKHEIKELLTRLSDEICLVLDTQVPKGEWDDMNETISVMRTLQSDYIKSLSSTLRTKMSTYLDNWFSCAVKAEEEGEIHKAGEYWQLYTAAPASLVRSKKRQYADEFAKRENQILSGRREKYSKNTLIIFFALWIMYLMPILNTNVRLLLAREVTMLEYGLNLLPALIHLGVFGLSVALMKKFKLLNKGKVGTSNTPVYITSLFYLALLTPLTPAVIDALLKINSNHWLILSATVFIWLAADVIRFKRNLHKGPGLWCLFASALAAAIIMGIYANSDSLTPWLGNLTAILHAIIFTIVDLFYKKIIVGLIKRSHMDIKAVCA